MIRVLLADDHAVVRHGLERLLSGFADVEVVATASDGEEAVQLAARERPDVALIDLQMPGVDGICATKRIREVSPETRVVVLTAFSDREAIVEVLDAGAAGYLLKDVQPDELVRAIEAAAAGEAPLHPRAARELLRGWNAGEPQLSVREEEVLGLLAQGLPNKLIARRLEISERTVKGHLTRIFERIGVTDRTQAALWAREHGR